VNTLAVNASVSIMTMFTSIALGLVVMSCKKVIQYAKHSNLHGVYSLLAVSNGTLLMALMNGTESGESNGIITEFNRGDQYHSSGLLIRLIQSMTEQKIENSAMMYTMFHMNIF
jgi:hypothetical protein